MSGRAEDASIVCLLVRETMSGRIENFRDVLAQGRLGSAPLLKVRNDETLPCRTGKLGGTRLYRD